MADFKQFLNTDTGEVVTYPAHFGDHPVFGQNLVPVDEEIETDKVVVAGHELPVDQRVSYFAADFDMDEDLEDEDDE